MCVCVCVVSVTLANSSSAFVCSDELNVDYNKLVKHTAVEGLRVEDLVKKYFEAAEKVLRVPTCTPHMHTRPNACDKRASADGAALPADRAGNGRRHPGVRRQGRERRHRAADQPPAGEDAAPPPGSRSGHGAGHRHGSKKVPGGGLACCVQVHVL